MNTADYLIQSLIKMREDATESDNLVEVKLVLPHRLLVEDVLLAGGKIDNLGLLPANNKADVVPDVTVKIPKSWIVGMCIDNCKKVFYLIDSQVPNAKEVPLFILPLEMPMLVYEVVSPDVRICSAAPLKKMQMDLNSDKYIRNVLSHQLN